MIPIDPNDASHAAKAASDYIAVYERLWPIGLTGGVVGVIFHAKEIRRSKTKAAAFVLTATEWAIGATSAMGLAMLFPAIVEFLPFPLTLGSPEAELGFFGFIGGSMGRELFRLVQRKFFGGWDGVERRQERRGDD